MIINCVCGHDISGMIPLVDGSCRLGLGTSKTQIKMGGFSPFLNFPEETHAGVERPTTIVCCIKERTASEIFWLARNEGTISHAVCCLSPRTSETFEGGHRLSGCCRGLEGGQWSEMKAGDKLSLSLPQNQSFVPPPRPSSLELEAATPVAPMLCFFFSPSDCV